MPTLKVPLDNDTYKALLENASQHFRPPLWHAAAILRTALGLPIPTLASGATVPFLSAEVLGRASSERELNAD
jgi:hypothetical protein